MMSLFSKFITRSHKRVAITGALFIVAGCSQGDSTQPPPPQIPEVGVYTLNAQPLSLTTRLPGRTASFRVAKVRPQVSGVILERYFQEGSYVEKGQPLYQIDPAPYRASLAQAKAALYDAESLAKRYEGLVASNAISQQQYDSAKAAWEAAKANLELAQINMEYTKVRAPISGKIGRSFVTEGALVTTNQPQHIAEITQLDPIYVDINQSIDATLKLRQAIAKGELKSTNDQTAEVRLSIGNGIQYPLSGTLQLSEVNVDESTGSVALRAQFPNQNYELLPGMFVHAEFVEATDENAILVPQQAVTRNPKGQGMVLVVGNDNTVQPRVIETLRTVGNAWLVSAGLEAGEKVITEGVIKVRPGMKVNPVPAKNVTLVTEFK